MNVEDFLTRKGVHFKNKWVAFFLRLTLYLVIAGIMLNISWYAWPDLVKDFGIELYIPWRITEGDILYRDILYYQQGPLPFYWNALWFYLFGASVNTLIIVNFILLVLLVCLLEIWLKNISNTFTTTIAVMFFIGNFAFSRYVEFGNYNYLAPYAQGATHGLILSIAALLCLKKWTDQQKGGWLFGAGILVGLTTLTKLELAVSLMIASGIYLVSSFIARRLVFKEMVKNFFVFIGGLVVPPIFTTISFSIALPFKTAVWSIFNQWVAIWDGRVAETSKSFFYRHSSGLDNVSGNLLKLGDWTWLYINFILIGLALSLVLSEIKNKKLIVYPLTAIFSFLIAYSSVAPMTWFSIVRPLPLVLASALIILVLKGLRRKDFLRSDRYPLYLASFSFAGAMLIKLGLATRIYNYGFILTMPAFLLAIVLFIYWLPKYLNRYGAGDIIKIMVLSVLVVISLRYFSVSQRNYGDKNFECCLTSKDRIMTSEMWGPTIENSLRELNNRLKPDQTFVVVPEGIILNYMLRHRNSIPYIHFVPTMFINNKESDIIDSLSKHPPDLVVFLHSDTSEFGVPFFGKDYGQTLYDWINKHYRIVWQNGDPPLQKGAIFGSAIAEKITKSNDK